MTMKLISSISVGAAGSSVVTFTNIPQDGTDLIISASSRSSTYDSNIYLRFNNISTSAYFGRFLLSTGTSLLSANASDSTSITLQNFLNSLNNVNLSFSSSKILISNYAASKAKAVFCESSNSNDTSSNRIAISAGKCSDTSPIASLTLTGSWGSNSVVSLYKVTKGSGGVTVS